MSYQCQLPSYHRCPFSERRVFGTENKGPENSSSHGTFFLAGSIGQPIKKENISVFFCGVIRFWAETFLLLWGPGKSSPIPQLLASDKQKIKGPENNFFFLIWKNAKHPKTNILLLCCQIPQVKRAAGWGSWGIRGKVWPAAPSSPWGTSNPIAVS